MKEVYVVVGVMDSGSASLTFPEDFEIKGFFTEREDACTYCENLNTENGVVTFGERISDEDSDPDDEDHEEDTGGPTDEMVYEVWDVKDLSKKK